MNLGSTFKPTHKHVKRGSEYEKIGNAQLQIDADTVMSDYAYMTVYRGEDGAIWVRPVQEFIDGRFEELPAPEEQEEDRYKDPSYCEALEQERDYLKEANKKLDRKNERLRDALKDMLEGDDAQAWKEARKILEQDEDEGQKLIDALNHYKGKKPLYLLSERDIIGIITVAVSVTVGFIFLMMYFG